MHLRESEHTQQRENKTKQNNKEKNKCKFSLHTNSHSQRGKHNTNAQQTQSNLQQASQGSKQTQLPVTITNIYQANVKN